MYDYGMPEQVQPRWPITPASLAVRADGSKKSPRSLGAGVSVLPFRLSNRIALGIEVRQGITVLATAVNESAAEKLERRFLRRTNL